MKTLKTLLLMALFLIAAYLIFQALMALTEMESEKSNDYFYVRTGWVSEPVLSESED